MGWRRRDMTGVQEITILNIFFGIIFHRTKFSPSSKKISSLISDETFSHFSKVKVLCRKVRMWGQIFALKIWEGKLLNKLLSGKLLATKAKKLLNTNKKVNFKSSTFNDKKGVFRGSIKTTSLSFGNASRWMYFLR